MKTMTKLAMVAAVAGVAMLGGCHKSTTKSDASMGTMSKDTCSSKGACTGDKAACTKDAKAAGSMGAVSEKKCCAGKAAAGCSEAKSTNN